MAVFSVILGVLLTIGGFSCIFTPLATFFATGYFLGIVLLIYGIAGIIRVISEKQGDALEWVLNILSIIVGVIAIVKPGTTLVFDGMLLIFIACWFVVQGVIQIVLAFKRKPVDKNWYWSLIVGILALIVGLISFAHPTFTAFSAGILIGFYFVEAGISLITLGIAAGSVEE